jgi:uncharacterized protein YqeY
MDIQLSDMKEKLDNDFKRAMLDKDQTKLNVLRGLKTAITNASIQKGNTNTALDESEMIQIVRKQINQRVDSIQQFVDGKRLDLVAKEEVELEILKEYLPEEINDTTLETIVVGAILDLNATSKKDMGRVIKEVVSIVNGQADNKRISKLVMEKLS